MEIRRAQQADFEGLVTLQNANLVSNLSDDQKREGFLSGGFTAEQFANMNDDLAVIVGVHQNVVRAFLCASTVEFNEQFALPKAMIERFPLARYDDKPLSNWRVCIAGPVCIDASLRGQGIFGMLHEFLSHTVRGQYELATVFVSKDNPRSIKAHEKVGMRIVDEFEFNSRQYLIMTGRMNIH